MKNMILAALGLIVIAFATIGGTAKVYAAFDPFTQPCAASRGQGSVCTEKTKQQNAEGENSIYGPNGIISKAINILSLTVGVVAVVMIIIGGFKYVVSSGDSNNTNAARNTILYAVIGLVIAASGQIIVRFILTKI